MESRLIFLHQNHCDGVTEKARSSEIYLVQACRQYLLVNPQVR